MAIPKVIHYVWLGRGEKPAIVKRCIASWHKYLPNYAIHEWNESNWDLHSSDFAWENYQARKYAYASDVIRLDVLNRLGGIYLDTDVEVFKSFDDLLQTNFIGMMYRNCLGTDVLGFEAHNDFLDSLLSDYRDFSREDMLSGKLPKTNNTIITQKLIRVASDFRLMNRVQQLKCGIKVYPKEYFEYPSYAKRINYSMHHFTKSWGDDHLGLGHKLAKSGARIALGKVLYGKISSYRGAKVFSFNDEYYNKVHYRG